MAGVSMSLIASALSLSLLASGSIKSSQLNGADPVAVASLQADLDVLGFNAGPLNGHISSASYPAVANYVTQFGQVPSQPLTKQVAHIVKSLPNLGTHLSGASVLAIQSWLAMWHLYQGPLNGQSSPTLIRDLNKFQQDAGIPVSNQFDGETLSTLAHLATIAAAVQHHWTYQAQQGDQMRQLAWATGIPLKRFEAMNPQHGKTLWVGQIVHFSMPPKQTARRLQHHSSSHRTSQHISTHYQHPPASTAVSTPKSSPPSSSPPPSAKNLSPHAPSGVLSNIQPIAAFVVYNPSKSALQGLFEAQKMYPHDLIDVAITGLWAVDHPRTMKALSQSGNEMIMSGYTGVSLNQLPGWGIRQEIQWEERAIHDTTGSNPVFVSQAEPFTQGTSNQINAQNVISMPPNVMVTSSHWLGSTAVSLLLKHSDQVVGSTIYPQSVAAWKQFFGQLQRHHFVFLNLGQIWAGGA